jgi:hypothetical protein
MRHMIVLLKALVKGLRNQKRNNSQTILERKVSIPPARKPVRRRRPTSSPVRRLHLVPRPLPVVQTPLIDDPHFPCPSERESQTPDDFLASPLPDLAIPPLPMPNDLDATLDRLLALFAAKAMLQTLRELLRTSNSDLNLNVDALTGTNDISQLFYTTDDLCWPSGL